MRINWKRLIWIIFIYLYSGLFFYNFLSPYNNWHISYIYTMILIIWLGVEYYEKHLFFQSGLLRYHHWLLRTLFALFFYSSFIIGLATIVWWPNNRIGFYPFIQIIGVALLIYSIILRRQVFVKKVITEGNISDFYLSLFFLTVSIALAYGSIFLVPYVIIIGYSLILMQKRYEKQHFKYFEEFIHRTEKSDKIKAKRYVGLWDKYMEELEKNQKKRGKK